MSAEIFGERFYGHRRPAWHGLGQVFDEALSPVEAVKQVGLDYTVGTYPLFAQAHEMLIETDKVAIMRSPTADDPEWKLFGTAGGKYEIIQNTQLAELMEPIAERWPLDSAGAIKDGKTMFMAFNTGGVEIEGDPINGYFTLVDTKDGGTATKLLYTPVRIVCQNTLVTGMKQASVSISLPHTAGAADMMKARINLIKNAQQAIDDTNLMFSNMANKQISKDQVRNIFEKIYPTPKEPVDASLKDYSEEDLGELLFDDVKKTMYNYNYYTKRAKINRSTARELYGKLNDEYPKLAGSAWHLYNAVVESADYREGGRDIDASAMFGIRAKEKQMAFAEIAKRVN